VSTPVSHTYTRQTDTTAPVVSANPAGGTFSTSQSVTLSANEPATIFYTIDGSTPTVSSTQYTGPLTFTATTTLRFLGRDTAGNVSTPVSHTYTRSAATPSWVTQDVGAVGAAGNGSFASATGLYTVRGAGADIWGTADAFHYMHQPLTGDGQIVARVGSLQNTHASAKAGVMIRSTLGAGSQQAMMIVTPGRGNAFQRRATTNGTSVSTAGAVVTAPYWVRLTRSGNTITAAQSANGTQWTTVGSATITMPANVLIGLAVTSHATGTLATATFDQVTVTGGTAPITTTAGQ
jgi:regulation of enolase protein 1 (concanavalin A-like superfamily)